MSKIYSAYSKKLKVQHVPDPEQSGAKQQMKEECDINNIMSRFQKTGMINHVNNHSPQYGFATSIDYREAVELVRKAEKMFADLPSSARNKFDNSPEAFLEFASNPENIEQMREMGLAEPIIQPVEPVQTTTETAPEEAE